MKYRNIFWIADEAYEAPFCELDLGELHDIAEVYINNKKVSVLWTNPFKTNITSFIEKGENTVEIRITNRWVNRLIGDLKERKSNTTFNYQYYLTQSPLLQSGLEGPVKLNFFKND